MIKSRITESAPNYEEFPLKIIAGVWKKEVATSIE
jgi:hypothetical protein